MKMMKIGILAFMLAGLVFSTARAGWDPAEGERAKASVEHFRNNAPSLDRFFEKAYGYVVFPDVFKGGFMMLGGGMVMAMSMSLIILSVIQPLLRSMWVRSLAGSLFRKSYFLRTSGSLIISKEEITS